MGCVARLGVGYPLVHTHCTHGMPSAPAQSVAMSQMVASVARPALACRQRPPRSSGRTLRWRSEGGCCGATACPPRTTSASPVTCVASTATSVVIEWAALAWLSLTPEPTRGVLPMWRLCVPVLFDDLRCVTCCASFAYCCMCGAGVVGESLQGSADAVGVPRPGHEREPRFPKAVQCDGDVSQPPDAHDAAPAHRSPGRHHHRLGEGPGV